MHINMFLIFSVHEIASEQNRCYFRSTVLSTRDAIDT